MWRPRTAGGMHAGMNSGCSLSQEAAKEGRVKKELSTRRLDPQRMSASEVEEKENQGRSSPRVGYAGGCSGGAAKG